MQNTSQHERKNSKTPVKVIMPDELCRVCRCSPAILGRGNFNLFSAQSKALKQADRLQTVLGQLVQKVSGVSSTICYKCKHELEKIYSSPGSHLGKTSLAKIIAHLTNSSPFKKCLFNRPIRFPGSNFDSGEINGSVIGSARLKELTT